MVGGVCIFNDKPRILQKIMPSNKEVLEVEKAYTCEFLKGQLSPLGLLPLFTSREDYII